MSSSFAPQFGLKLGELGDMSSAGGLIDSGNTTMIDSERIIKGGNMTLDLSAG
jgi:hypothetical protein